VACPHSPDNVMEARKLKNRPTFSGFNRLLHQLLAGRPADGQPRAQGKKGTSVRERQPRAGFQTSLQNLTAAGALEPILAAGRSFA